MTPVEELQVAARVMRKRAEAATPGPWQRLALGIGVRTAGLDHYVVKHALGHDGDPNRAFVLGMHPPVALAVADWLDGCASRAEQTSRARLEHDDAEQAWFLPSLAVARVYLGGAA